MKRTEVTQCKSCPWRVDCDPDKDIPNYSRDLHAGLTSTINSGTASMFGPLHIMACHYSEHGDEFPCAGWLYNQLGPGNNIGLRIAVMTKRMPGPVVDGEQHETLEDTMPVCSMKKRRRSNAAR